MRGDAITVLGLPRAALSPDQTVCADTTTTLTVAGTPPGATYNWSPTTGLNTNIEPMVTATPTATTYTARVTTAAGCTGSVTAMVTRLGVLTILLHALPLLPIVGQPAAFTATIPSV